MTLWGTILASALTSASLLTVAAFIGRTVIGGSISHAFNRRLENYKHQLLSISEQFRFEHERRTTDFSLYIRTKHEKYAKLFELLLIADGLLMSKYGLRRQLTFEEFTKADMVKHLKANKVVEGYIPKLLANWDTDRETCLRDVNKYLWMLEFQFADRARIEAKNFLVVNALYLSPKAEFKVEALFKIMVELHVSWEMSAEHGPGAMDEVKKWRATITEKDRIIEEIKNLMRQELSLGAAGYEPETQVANH